MGNSSPSCLATKEAVIQTGWDFTEAAFRQASITRPQRSGFSGPQALKTPNVLFSASLTS